MLKNESLPSNKTQFLSLRNKAAKAKRLSFKDVSVQRCGHFAKLTIHKAKGTGFLDRNFDARQCS